MNSSNADTSTFPYKLYDMIKSVCDAPAPNYMKGGVTLVTWLARGDGFVILDQQGFMEHIVSGYFNLTKMRSLTRQLNLYGFKRIPSENDHVAWQHPHFLRDDSSQLELIKRTAVKGIFKRKKLSDIADSYFKGSPDDAKKALALPATVAKKSMDGLIDFDMGPMCGTCGPNLTVQTVAQPPVTENFSMDPQVISSSLPEQTQALVHAFNVHPKPFDFSGICDPYQSFKVVARPVTHTLSVEPEMFVASKEELKEMSASSSNVPPKLLDFPAYAHGALACNMASGIDQSTSKFEGSSSGAKNGMVMVPSASGITQKMPHSSFAGITIPAAQTYEIRQEFSLEPPIGSQQEQKAMSTSSLSTFDGAFNFQDNAGITSITNGSKHHIWNLKGDHLKSDDFKSVQSKFVGESKDYFAGMMETEKGAIQSKQIQNFSDFAVAGTIDTPSADFPFSMARIQSCGTNDTYGMHSSATGAAVRTSATYNDNVPNLANPKSIENWLKENEGLGIGYDNYIAKQGEVDCSNEGSVKCSPETQNNTTTHSDCRENNDANVSDIDFKAFLFKYFPPENEL